MTSSSSRLQYYHRLSKGSIHYGPATINITSETQQTTSIEVYEFCHEQNSSSNEFSMTNEVSISGVVKAFDIGASHSNTFSKVSTKATQEGKDIKTYQEEFTSRKVEISRELKDDQFLVHYVLINLCCFTINGGTEKHYARIPCSDTIVEALDKDEMERISKGTIHLEKDSFQVVASRYPSIKLDDIPVLARKLTPFNIEVNLSSAVILWILNHMSNGSCIYDSISFLVISCATTDSFLFFNPICYWPPAHQVALGTRKTSSHEESYSDRGTGSREDLSVWKSRLFDNEYRILYIATTSRHYSGEVLVVTQGMYHGKPALAAPKHFECQWTDRSTGGNRDGSLWKAIPPSSDYVALSDVAIHRSNDGLSPGVTMAANHIDSKFMCVLKSLCSVTELGGNPIWTDAGSGGRFDGATWSIRGSLGMRVSRGRNDRPSQQQYKLNWLVIRWSVDPLILWFASFWPAKMLRF